MVAIPDLVNAVIGSVFVMILMMTGSGIGEEVASFVFGKVKGGFSQIVYLMFFLPLFVVGGYVYTLLNIPQTSLTSTAIFFGLWGFLTVFVSRFLINMLNKALGIKFIMPKKSLVNGKDLVKYLKEKKMPEHEIRTVLMKSCDSKRKAEKLFEGGSEWVSIDPDPLCYELSKRGFSAHDVMEILKDIIRLTPEEAAIVWKNSSV